MSGSVRVIQSHGLMRDAYVNSIGIWSSCRCYGSRSGSICTQAEHSYNCWSCDGGARVN